MAVYWPSREERLMRQQIKPLLGEIKDVQKSLKKMVVETMKNPLFRVRNILPFHNTISRQYNEMGQIFKRWASYGITKSYMTSLQLIRSDLSMDKSLAKDPAKTIQEIMSSRATGATTNLAERIVGRDFTAGLRAGEKDLKKWSRQAQYALAKNPDLEFDIFKGLATRGNLDASITAIEARFFKEGAAHVDAEGFIKVGKRRMKPDAYARLLARTKFHELQSQAALVECKNYDTDLIKVSSHNGPSDVCKPFEGQRYSISGQSKKYPKMTELPPYHPNCRHTSHPDFDITDEAV